MLLTTGPKVGVDYVYDVSDDPSCQHLLVSPAQARFQRNTGRQRHGGCLLIKGERPQAEQWRSGCCYAHLSRRKATNT